MTCPKPEVLSQWADGSLDAREAASVARHADGCAGCAAKARELRAVGAWIAGAVEPGPSCLSAEDMAAALESGRVPAHARTCPRCAAEFRALKPEKETKRATRRREKAQSPMRAWAVAAAVFVAVGILLVVAVSQSSAPKVEFAYRPPTPVNPHVSQPLPPFQPTAPRAPAPIVQEPEKAPIPPSAPQASAPAQPSGEKSPVPAEPQPTIENPTPAVRDRIAETVTQAPVRVAAALALRSGSLSALTVDGKWAKPARVEEGMTLRADGRTTVEFAQARVTLDSASRFSVSKEEFALLEGGLSAEVSTGGHFVLVLDEQRFFPQTQNARVLLCAKPDRLLIEEGGAKAKDLLLHEGTEYGVKKDSIEARKTRSLPAAARSREQLTWRMDLLNQNVVKKNVVGRVDKGGADRMLVSEPMGGGAYYGQVIYNNGGEAAPVFTVKPGTAIRFRYFLREPGHLELVMWNGTKQENFNKVLEPAVRQWTTVTIPAKDVPANRGGKPVTCEAGDKYTSVGFFVGTAGMPSEVYIDRLEIVEIDK
ncbi:MAG: zf-HC2 domain-containing protein [Planctomycetaceae bacterium]|nr:zf-HC2 domain-containing protein [Planctomycetaceae bacterium]